MNMGPQNGNKKWQEQRRFDKVNILVTTDVIHLDAGKDLKLVNLRANLSWI